MMTALGSAERPTASRSTARRSSSSASKQPHASQAAPAGRPLPMAADRAASPAGLDDIAQAVERLAQGILPLPGVLWQQGQIRRNQRPLVVGNIRRVRFASNFHRIGYEDYSPQGP